MKGILRVNNLKWVGAVAVALSHASRENVLPNGYRLMFTNTNDGGFNLYKGRTGCGGNYIQYIGALPSGASKTLLLSLLKKAGLSSGPASEVGEVYEDGLNEFGELVEDLLLYKDVDDDYDDDYDDDHDDDMPLEKEGGMAKELRKKLGL